MTTLETIVWRSVDVERPKPGDVVLVDVDAPAELTPWLGFYELEAATGAIVWYYVGAEPIGARVHHWAELPTGARV